MTPSASEMAAVEAAERKKDRGAGTLFLAAGCNTFTATYLQDKGYTVWRADECHTYAAVHSADGIVVPPDWESNASVRRLVHASQDSGQLVYCLVHSISKPEYAVLVLLDFQEPNLDKPVEEVVVNAQTGGEKAQKLARFDLLPPHALWQVAEAFGRGARKYKDRNWERGYDWSLSYQALQRHLAQWWGGEEADPDSHIPHLASAAFHVLALLEFADTHPELDNRPERGTGKAKNDV